MRWIVLIISIFVTILSIASAEYEVVYERKNSKVILTESTQLSEKKLNKYGKSVCSNNQFCVLWFYSDRKKAEVGTKAMEKGDMFAQTPGMYGIFSKNKVANNVICYEPVSGC